VLRDMADRIDARCAGGGWIVGEAFSLADINAAPYAKRLDELAPKELTAAKRPHAAAWWSSVQARPGYIEAEIGDFMEQSQEGWPSAYHTELEKPE